MIQYQIPQTNITRTIWLTVRRITNEILGVKGLIENANTGQNFICVILLMKIWYNKIKLISLCSGCLKFILKFLSSENLNLFDNNYCILFYFVNLDSHQLNKL